MSPEPLDVYEYYVALEPNHDIEIDDEGYQIVICPFDFTEDGQLVMHDHPAVRSTPWSPNATPEEVNCLVCEVLNGELHYAGPPVHEHAGEDELEPDGPDPIGGGAHGGVHHIREYAPCKIPLRRISWLRVTITVHEGAVASLGRIEDRYEAANGYERYPVRQAVTAFYVCRKTVSGRSWSIHALCAGDINWDRNPYGKKLITDMPKWFIQLFLDEGWGWGGNWNSVKDAMHFSKAPHEGGNGLLYVGTIEEDDVTKEEVREAVVEVLSTLTPRDLPEGSILREIWDAEYEKVGGKTIEATDEIRNVVKSEVASATAEILAAIRKSQDPGE